MRLRTRLRRTLVKTLGKQRFDAALEVLRSGRYRVASAVDPALRENRELLSSFHNKHAGTRCFIIGNGPSLKQTNLGLLRNEITFGLNRIYLLFPELGYQTTYHVTVNDHVLRQFKDDILKLEPFRFLTERARSVVGNAPRTAFLRTIDPYRFSKDVRRGVWEGATVTYVAMQLAYYMGFGEVVLLGVDHNFASKGDPHKLVTSAGPDQNHFHPDYFGKGVEWQLPDLELSEYAYRLAKRAYEADGRRITNATVGGKLEVFPRRSLEEVLSLGGR